MWFFTAYFFFYRPIFTFFFSCASTSVDEDNKNLEDSYKEDAGDCCLKCGEEPCCALAFKTELQESIEHCQTADDFDKLTPKELRFRAYSHFTSNVYGFLGKDNRIPLPVCCEMAIRNHYPEPSGVYIGFQDQDDDGDDSSKNSDNSL